MIHSLRDRVVSLATAALFISLVPLATPASAQEGVATASGTVEGRVMDAASGEPLPGARILVDETGAETSTGRDGMFRLAGLSAGPHTLMVSYLGRKDERVDVTVAAGAPE